MIAGILRLDGAGFTKNRDVTKRITVSCRQASVLFSAILKTKGIPCRSRAGFMDFGDAGESYMEHWVNEYWDFRDSRWALADVDGYYEYEPRFGYSQFDLPRRKFVTASEAWLGLRKGTLHKKLDVTFVGDGRQVFCLDKQYAEYLLRYIPVADRLSPYLAAACPDGSAAASQETTRALIRACFLEPPLLKYAGLSKS